ncbi:hypothetical protein AD006_22980 [Pseudonocardia sp. EC080610-09]|uniref:hypothetical protein n=1 Tax=unclassified Pseudonocardia TaxID=2619320 RepID=UPI0006CB0641|nr:MULTISPECIES: hypothetical protein [unclassified Pseudonocardia]ALE74047.1 hypothetical protein FRP1_15325 [Pseudonocardia sp. EC080625-04]ALL77458.1 hypothetical protein AD006_22980 [Pseudonocardia sp. EC080610-09]ALL80373.1 hypothetical protein AD017_02570 [Pseudonocardia sp. EC080619-01]
MTQVGPESVLAVHAVLAAQAEAMNAALSAADWMRDIPRCGDDPVSIDAKAARSSRRSTGYSTGYSRCTAPTSTK